MLSGTGRFACEPACEVEAPLHTWSIATVLGSSHIFGRNSLEHLGSETASTGVFRLGHAPSLNMTAHIDVGRVPHICPHDKLVLPA